MYRDDRTDSSESEDDGYDAETLGFSSSRWYGPMSDDEHDDYKDLTACDSECGYCGRCPY